jgi:hypothetical protein
MGINDVRQLTPTSKIIRVHMEPATERWQRPEAIRELAGASVLTADERAAALAIADSIEAERTYTRAMEAAEPDDQPYRAWADQYRRDHPEPPSLETWSDTLSTQRYTCQGITVQCRGSARGGWGEHGWDEEIVIAAATDRVWESHAYADGVA